MASGIDVQIMSFLASKVGLLLAGVHLVNAWTKFTVPHTPGEDDTPALLAALPNYVENATILFKGETTYNIFTPIKFPVFNNVEILISGNLSYPDDIPTIQGTYQRQHIAMIKLFTPSEAIVGASVGHLYHRWSNE